MEPSSRRSRRACEPCRRKKSKCTGERPICSFCERLSRKCEYAARGTSMNNASTRVQSVLKKSTKDRVRNLESQVASLSELLMARTSSSGADVSTQAIACATSRDGSPAENMDMTVSRILSFSDDQPGPPQEVIAYFIKEYGTTVHLQPLPLFDFDNLTTKLTSAPRYLVHSFLALMLEFSSHGFYDGKQSQAAGLYTRSAVATTQQLASEGKPRVELIQALCLLSLKDIKGGDLARAWMSIGTAARLQSVCTLQPSQSLNTDEQDIHNRCYWSICMIEAAFFPHMPRAPDSNITRKHPPSAEPPPSIPLDTNEVNAPDFDNAVGATDDVGINTHAGRMISVWSRVANHLHEIKMGEVQIPWLPESTYSKLNLTLFEYEAQFHQRHLMRNLFPFKRLPDEIRTYRQYWNPWLTTHLILHASLALLNHPFIHLVALRRNKGISQSRLFLQQVVDQALFHSGWVFWLIGIFEDLSVEISNPLIGLAVAATSTIPWLYQFVRNAKVARKASQNLAKGQRFLERLSKAWPCMSQKLESLKRLQSLVIGTPAEAGSIDTTINFPPSMIWELLDPIMQNTSLPDGSQSSFPESQSYVSIHVTTDFLHPLADDDVELSPVNWQDDLMYGNDLLHDLYPISLVPFDFQ